MKITDDELKKLEACRNEDDWNETCSEIKRARGGQYPEDWWARVKLSGLMDRVVRGFGGNPEIKVQAFRG